MLIEKNNELSISKIDLEIYQRRQKVWSLYIQGFTQEQIAKKCDVHTRTIFRDFTALKNDSIEWMETLPEGGIQLYHRKIFEGIEDVINELYKILENTKNLDLKRRILNDIAAKNKMKSDMLDAKKFLKTREMMIHERDYKSYYGRTPHHLNPAHGYLSKIGQNL